MGNFTTTVDTEGGARELNHGVTICATGGDFLRPEEYLYGKSDRVTCWHELESLFEKEPGRLDQAKAVAFIHCVGSREPDRPYCSKICCTASVRQAMELKARKPDLDVYVLYRDMRTYGRREEAYRKAREMGVIFFRYSREEKPLVEQVSGEGLQITLTDHVLGAPIKLDVDYVNLFTAIVPRGKELSKLFKVPLNDDGFFLEAHMKLRPVEFSTDGLFTCGLAHYPKPIEESIAQARATASRASTLLAQKQVRVEPLVSVVDQDKCMGCGYCESACPFGAIKLVKIEGKGYRAENLPALCKGCGICAAGCPQKAIDMFHFRDGQIEAAIQAGGESAIHVKQGLRAGESSLRVVSGYKMAPGVYYHEGHTWVHLEKGGRVRIGMDDFAGRILGPANEFRLPERGTTLRKDREGWSLRCKDKKAAFLSPMTGKVFSVNERVLENPEISLEDPYKEGWLLVLEPRVREGELKRLYQDEQGIEWLEKESRKLLELLGPEYARLAATGGEPVVDILGHFPEINWETLVRTFLKTQP